MTKLKLTCSRCRCVCSGCAGCFLHQPFFVSLLCNNTRPGPRLPVRLSLRLRIHFDQRVARLGENWGHWAHLCWTTFSWLNVCFGKAVTRSMTLIQALSFLSRPHKTMIQSILCPLSADNVLNHLLVFGSVYVWVILSNRSDGASGNLQCAFPREARGRHTNKVSLANTSLWGHGRWKQASVISLSSVLH